MEQTIPEMVGGRHDASAGADGAARAGWRIAERVISVAIGGAALSGAIYLGVTGPLISPVAAPAAQAAGVTTNGAATVGTPSTGGTVADDGARGDHGGGGRHR